MDSPDSIKYLFEPKSVAVAGVSTDSNKLGSIIFSNLRRNVAKGLLKAAVYALNPSHGMIGDVRCYPSVVSLPEIPELVVIAVPVALTLPIVKEAAEAGVKAAVIVTSGFAEAGRKDLEDEILAVSATHGMRVLGPNTIGLLDTWSGVDLLFLRQTKALPDGKEIVSLIPPRKGGVVIITQSGHLGEIISEELTASGIGIRALIGTGNQLDVSVEDVLGYFGEDEHADLIAMYLEGVRDGVEFVRKAAEASRRKPVVVLKVGKTSAGARAALTHTASMTGDHLVYEAAFRRAGVIEVPDFQGLLDACVALSRLPHDMGSKLVILTNAGGVGAIAADEAQRSGLMVDALGAKSLREFRAQFSSSRFISTASLVNPIDLTASTTTDEFVRVTEFVTGLPEYDAALILPTHQTPAIDYDISARLSEIIKHRGKPVCVCVMGRSELADEIHAEFMNRGIPSFPTPERAVRALAAVASYASLRQKVASLAPLRKSDAFSGIGQQVGFMDQSSIGRLLRFYGIRQPRSVILRSVRDVAEANIATFPVACKLLSPGMTHKTDAGGVILGIANRRGVAATLSSFKTTAIKMGVPFEGMLVQEMVRDGIEMIVGANRNPVFGPLILFGFGGTHTELTRDFSVEMAPVSPRQAREMIGRTGMKTVLEGFRGGTRIDVRALSELISRFSNIIAENPSLGEIEINPLIATQDSFYAVDTRANVVPQQRHKSLPWNPKTP